MQVDVCLRREGKRWSWSAGGGGVDPAVVGGSLHGGRLALLLLDVHPRPGQRQVVAPSRSPGGSGGLQA